MIYMSLNMVECKSISDIDGHEYVTYLPYDGYCSRPGDWGLMKLKSRGFVVLRDHYSNRCNPFVYSCLCSL